MIYGRASSCRTYNVMEESTLKNIIDRIAKNSVFDTIFVNFRCTIGDLTLGTGFHGKSFFLHFYRSTHFLLALWKDLAELHQE